MRVLVWVCFGPKIHPTADEGQKRWLARVGEDWLAAGQASWSNGLWRGAHSGQQSRLLTGIEPWVQAKSPALLLALQLALLLALLLVLLLATRTERESRQDEPREPTRRLRDLAEVAMKLTQRAGRGRSSLRIPT
jgi:hypothetical protein